MIADLRGAPIAAFAEYVLERVFLVGTERAHDRVVKREFLVE